MAMDAVAHDPKTGQFSRAGHEAAAETHKAKAIASKKTGDPKGYANHSEAASYHRAAAQYHPNAEHSKRAMRASKLANSGKSPQEEFWG
jgi:hypothetical protein